MTTESPIRSLAQHRMLSRAATDEAYAAERGITAKAAQTMLDAHAAAGAPELPERASAPKAAAPRAQKPRKYKLLGMA